MPETKPFKVHRRFDRIARLTGVNGLESLHDAHVMVHDERRTHDKTSTRVPRRVESNHICSVEPTAMSVRRFLRLCHSVSVTRR